MRLVLLDPVWNISNQMCLLGHLALCLWQVDLSLHLVKYEAVITVGIFICFRCTVILYLFSCDLVCRFLLLCKVSVFFTCLAQIFLCWTGKALCMSGITTFGAAILTAMSLWWMGMFLVWWFAFSGFEVLLMFFDLSSSCGRVQSVDVWEGCFGLPVQY